MESRIADAILQNNQLLKVGLRFEFAEVRLILLRPFKVTFLSTNLGKQPEIAYCWWQVMDKVSSHLIKNIDRLRKERVKTDGVTEKKEWKPARVLDAEEEEEE